MESDQPQFYPPPSSQLHGTKRTHSGSRIPQTAAHHPEPEATSPPLAPSQTPITQEVIGHIYELRHLDDQHILELLRVARHPVRDRSSVATFSTLSSRASSNRVPSLYSDSGSSIASDVSFNWPIPASRLSNITSYNKYECTECNVKLRSKQYWKSHEEEFHEQERMWKCPDCERWFNAGKRFREHHFKHHGCDVCEQPKEKGNGSSRIPSPCVTAAEKIKHRKDAWGCGFCVRLLSSWDERCTHVLQHFDEGKTKADWDFTNVILSLLLQPELSNKWHLFLFRKYGERSEEWPKFTWDQKKSRGLRFSLEVKWDTNTRQYLTGLIQKLHDLGSPLPSNLGIQIMHTDTEVLPESFQEAAMGQSKGTTVLPSHIVSQQEIQQPTWGIPSQSASKSTATEHDLQDFTEDTAGEKRPGAAKAREVVSAEASPAGLSALPHIEIIHSSNLTHLDSQHGIGGTNPTTLAPLPMINLAPTDGIWRDYSNVQRPRHEISDPPYQDRSQPSQLAEVLSRATQAAEFYKALNQQRTSRAKYPEKYWKRPYEAAQQFPPQPHAQIPMAQSPMHAMHQAIHPDQMHHRSPGMGMNPTGSHEQPQAYGYPNQMWPPSQPPPSPLSQQHNMQQYGQPQPRNPYRQPLMGESSTRSEGPPSNADGASRAASSSSHMLPNKCDDLSSGNWEGLLDLIPDDIRWDLRFTTVFDYEPCWTCTPAEYVPIENIPLTIAGAPVVIPVKYHYPLRASVAPPPDPHPKFISPGMSISDTIIEEIFSVYKEAIGFYLLVNGFLQIIVPEDFDLEYALSHRSNEFGGLKVSYIYQSLMPTGGTAEDTSTPSQPHNQGQPSTTLTVKSSHTPATSALGISVTQGPSGPIRALNPFELRIGSLVQAHVKGSKAKERFEAKLGLRTTSNNRFYLSVPTHIITQALTAAKSSSFPAGDWAEEVKIYSSNGNVEIGGIAETFDLEAGIFPVGFLHDTSLIEVSDASMRLASGVQSPLPLEWLSQAGWSNIKYQSRNLFLLDNLNLRAKSIGILDSQCVIVGQGIFKNKQNATRRSRFFSSRENDSSHDLGTWTSFISRSLLYRVNPEFRSPGAQSGTVVCFREELENGAIQGKVAGFSSFVQEVADTQRFEMEGTRLYSRLQEGRVAFYGAFQTPQKLREHIIL